MALPLTWVLGIQSINREPLTWPAVDVVPWLLAGGSASRARAFKTIPSLLINFFY